MTPSDLETTARERYNAVGETFWSQNEMLRLMYSACLELATETFCIESSATQSTVASQQAYNLPTNAIAIKRVTYNGNKLRMINMREDDAITLNNSITADVGNSQYYFVWNQVVYLRPIPDAINNLTIYTYNEPAAITISSTLEIPTVFHPRIVNFMLSEMYAKDKDFNTAAFYLKKWEKDKFDVKRWLKQRKRTDAFTTVMDEESLPETFLGAV